MLVSVKDKDSKKIFNFPTVLRKGATFPYQRRHLSLGEAKPKKRPFILRKLLPYLENRSDFIQLFIRKFYRKSIGRTLEVHLSVA